MYVRLDYYITSLFVKIDISDNLISKKINGI